VGTLQAKGCCAPRAGSHTDEGTEGIAFAIPLFSGSTANGIWLAGGVTFRYWCAIEASWLRAIDFVFMNVITGAVKEMTLQQVFAKARKTYPKMAVAF
jgi:hypothetical protein